MDRGTDYGVAKSQTRLKRFSKHAWIQGCYHKSTLYSDSRVSASSLLPVPGPHQDTRHITHAVFLGSSWLG